MDAFTGLTSERYANLAYKNGDLFAIACADSQGTIRKSVDTSDHTVLSILTFPCTDLAGDYVNPAGLEFHEHIANPEVDVEHSRSAEFGALIVAKCQHPDGRYAVDYRNLKLDNGSTHYLPVAKSYFDKDSRPSMQVFSMVERDLLPGVSLEFKALSGRPLGPSPLEKRQAYEFDRVSVVRYSHCRVPVNPSALTVTKSLDSLIPVVQKGKIGSEPIDPRLLGVLKKSIATYTPKRVLVAGGFQAETKAMPNDPNTIYDQMNGNGGMNDGMDDGMDDGMMDEGPSGPPTAAAAHEAAQAISDVIDQTEEKLNASEHVAGKKKILKVLEMLRQRAVRELIGIGDQVTQDVNGDTMGGMSGDDETPDVEDDATDPEDEEDGDEDEGDDGPPRKKGKGVMKAFSHPSRLWVRKSVLAVHKGMLAVRKKRYRKSDIDAAETKPVLIKKAAETTPEPDIDPELEAEIEHERKAFERAEREKRRKQRIYG